MRLLRNSLVLLVLSFGVFAGDVMFISGGIVDLLIRSKVALADYPVSLETHDLHVSETSGEVAIVYRPKDSMGQGRGNMSKDPAVTVVFDKESGDVKDIYYVR